MSQRAGRKSLDEKDKDKLKPSESPITVMNKKKAPTNANQDKPADKTVDKAEKKTEKASEKSTEKNGVDKEKEKTAQEKGADKNVKPTPQPKPKDGTSSTKGPTSTNGPNGTPANGPPANGAPGSNATTTSYRAPSSNGASGPSNGASGPKGPSEPNGTSGPNGTANGGEVVTVSDSEDDELFPELTYDESDVEPPTPDGGRSYTRRSQVKASRTPETPRPASGKQDNNAAAAAAAQPSKDAKVLQMKEGVTNDRKLRSADSPKPESKRVDSPKPEGKNVDSPKKGDTPKKVETPKKGEKEQNGVMEVEVTVEIENEDEPRKTDTNYSKSRVKVSPYRRSGRLADQTNTSMQANYTGNNTTMETDITISSLASEEQSLDDSYLRTIRGMKGRRSYKLLKDIQYTHTPRPKIQATDSIRPTAPVVGRKRKPESIDSPAVELAAEADESPAVATKRMRLFDRITIPFRRTVQPIVGINTDLSLTEPAAEPAFDPESLKTGVTATQSGVIRTSADDAGVPAASETMASKRCVIM